MGCEDFQVMLKFQNTNITKLCDFLNSYNNINLVIDGYYEYRDDNHVIEFEVRDFNMKTEISLRFALCNPSTVDDIYLKLIDMISSKYQLRIFVMDAIDDAYNVSNIKSSILYKRKLWKKDFGDKTGALNCKEAIEKFVIN